MNRSFTIFRAVLCLSTALMMAISWPLWVTGGSFPRVPWFGWVRLLPGWVSWFRLVIALAAMVAAAWPGTWLHGAPTDEVGPTSARITSAALWIALVLSAWMVLEDQFRLQPWMYQFLLMGLTIASCRPGTASRLCRLLAVALYLHSGLSKLNHEFLEGSGLWFLIVVMRWFQVEAWQWGTRVQRAWVLAMPCYEIALAGGFAFGLRRSAMVGAAILHLALIAILGPFGLEHSLNVLIWNAAMLAEVVFLFARHGEGRPASPSPRHRRVAPRIVIAVILAAAVLPFGEPGGWWDSWPSFALYSNSNESIVFEDAAPLAAHTGPSLPLTHSQGGQGWSDIDLGRWSLEERRVPIYPSARALTGVAEALVGRYGGGRPVQVVVLGHAERRTGRRLAIKLSTLESIRRHGETYWLNSHPAPD